MQNPPDPPTGRKHCHFQETPGQSDASRGSKNQPQGVAPFSAGENNASRPSPVGDPGQPEAGTAESETREAFEHRTQEAEGSDAPSTSAAEKGHSQARGTQGTSAVALERTACKVAQNPDRAKGGSY